MSGATGMCECVGWVVRFARKLLHVLIESLME